MTPPVFDVAWNDRVDFDEWQPPLPPGEDPWPTEPPSRWPDVRVELVLPPEVTPGDRVEYVVVLRNVSKVPVELRPCGGYEQEVMRVGAGYAAVSLKGGKSSYRLNCDDDPILGPSESRRYDMHLDVPDSVTGDEVLFRWGFVDNMPDYDGQSWVPLSPASTISASDERDGEASADEACPKPSAQVPADLKKERVTFSKNMPGPESAGVIWSDPAGKRGVNVSASPTNEPMGDGAPSEQDEIQVQGFTALKESFANGVIRVTWDDHAAEPCHFMAVVYQGLTDEEAVRVLNSVG